MRMYNECPDDGLNDSIEKNKQARQGLLRHGLHAVYFPLEGKYQVFKGYDLVGDFHDTILDCLKEIQ